MRAMRSEGRKLTRKAMLLGGAGTMVGLAVLITALLFLVAKPQSDILAEAAAQAAAAANGTAAPTQQQGSVPLEFLARGNLATSFATGAQLLGVVSLVLFASNLGAEYSQGTLKVMLSREPRRLVVLGGKLAAMALFVVLSILAAFVAQALVATLLASARGVSMTDWWTPAALGDAGLVLLRTCAAALGWGAVGTLLAVVLRASAPAIGIGIGYTLVGEPILSLALKDVTRWLPGQVLQAFIGWGSPTLGGSALPVTPLPGPVAAAVLATYTAGLVLAAAVLFQVRDVST